MRKRARIGLDGANYAGIYVLGLLKLQKLQPLRLLGARLRLSHLLTLCRMRKRASSLDCERHPANLRFRTGQHLLQRMQPNRFTQAELLLSL